MTIVQLYSLIRELENLSLKTRQGVAMLDDVFVNDRDSKYGLRCDFKAAFFEKLNDDVYKDMRTIKNALSDKYNFRCLSTSLIKGTENYRQSYKYVLIVEDKN